MKKILSLLLAALLCMTLFVSCIGKDVNPDNKNDNEITENGNKENNPPKKNVGDEDKNLSELREDILDSGAILGIAYLGYYEGTFDEIKAYLGNIGLYDEYSFVKDIKSSDFFETDGFELYLVVPASKDVPCEIYEGVVNYDTYAIEKGELIGKTDAGKPFIVKGNQSEIVSNIILYCDEFEYSPALSGEDGQLVEDYGVYDFSPYEAVYEYFGISGGDVSDGADPVFCGSWYCEAENGNYELVSMVLNLYVDNTAEYSYGFGNSEPVEYFVGDWTYDAERDMVLLGLYGGEVDADFVFVDPYVLECGFKWSMEYRDDGTYLTLIHDEGDPILWGKNGATFEFVNILEDDYEDYSYLCATWAIISEKKEIYLELFEGGEAHYGVKSDEEETNLWGYWSAEGLTLYLDFYGEDYGEAEGNEPIYSGEYGIMYDGELLTLSLFEGDALTSFMSEQGYDSFMCYGVG